MNVDYEKAWIELRERLNETEQWGNMLQQSMANSYLEMLNEIERECIIKDENKLSRETPKS